MATWLFVLLFGFVIIGARVLLAVVVIYCLTPRQASCVGCDGDTIVLTALPGLATAGRLLRIERRWCVRCGRTTLTRAIAPPPEPAVALRQLRGRTRP